MIDPLGGLFTLLFGFVGDAINKIGSDSTPHQHKPPRPMVPKTQHSKATNLIVLVLIGLVIVVVVVVIVFTNNTKQENIKNEIITGYSEIMDVVLEEYLGGTGTDKWGNTRENEYALKMGVEEINYQIMNITTEEGLYRSSHDDVYVLDVEIRLVCNKSGTIDDIRELADEVFFTFRDIQGIISGIEIGDYECSYYPREDPYYAYEELITIYVNDNKVLSPYRHEPSDDNNNDNDNSVKCRITGCGKEPVYTDWVRRYCSEHINDTHYCRYPGCTNQISNSINNRYCSEHKSMN